MTSRDPTSWMRAEYENLVACTPDATGNSACISAVIVMLVGHRTDHPLHRETACVEVPVEGELDRLEVLEQR